MRVPIQLIKFIHKKDSFKVLEDIVQPTTDYIGLATKYTTQTQNPSKQSFLFFFFQLKLLYHIMYLYIQNVVYIFVQTLKSFNFTKVKPKNNENNPTPNNKIIRKNEINEKVHTPNQRQKKNHIYMKRNHKIVTKDFILNNY